jgi:hypothetical protein
MIGNDELQLLKLASDLHLYFPLFFPFIRLNFIALSRQNDLDPVLEEMV